MSAEEYNPLPDIIYNDINIDLPPDLRSAYDRFEKEYFMELDDGDNIEVFNQVALMNKCLQWARDFQWLQPGNKYTPNPI